MIIVNPIAGLCNRMRVINSCIALKDRNDHIRRIKMVWEKSHELNCAFTDLFEPIEEIEIIDSHPGIDYLKFFFDNKTLSLRRRIKKFFLDNRFKDYAVFNNEKTYAFQYNNNYWDTLKTNCLIRTYSEFYSSEENNHYKYFVPVLNLQERIKAQTQRFFKNTIGVHIRRTDNLQSTTSSTDDLFIRHLSGMLENDSNILFYLATDDPHVEKLFKERFRNNIMVQENKCLDRNCKEGIEDALVDLYVLSSSDRIIGSYYSSFSEVASYINQIPLQVIK